MTMFSKINTGRFSVLLAAMLLFSAVEAGAQSRLTVTGTVYDSDGEPLPGAAVMEQGTNNGTITILPGGGWEIAGDAAITGSEVVDQNQAAEAEA